MLPHKLLPLAGAALLLATAALSPTIAHADEGVMTPISGGIVVGPGVSASTLGAGIGGVKGRVGFELIGRAMLGQHLTAGMGGPRGSFDFVDKDKVQFGAAIAATFGAGRFRRSRTGLLAAGEPGLFLRVLTEKVGAFQFDVAWYQPVRFPRDGFRGGAMASISWLPIFEH